MKIKKREIYQPCIHIIGNLASDKDFSITERLIDEHVLCALLDILETHFAIQVAHDVVWVLTNLSVANTKVITQIANNERFHMSMFYILEHFVDRNVNLY